MDLSQMDTSTSDEQGMLQPWELFWCNHQKWLEANGYMLRARYLPGWKPSWIGTKKEAMHCEDGQYAEHAYLLDATRISDGRFVKLKVIRKSVHPYEVEIGRFLSSEPLASDAHNHCVPILDVLQVPNDNNREIIVMPLLRKYDDPRFDTVGECVEFFRQIFEGLQFMHKHHVAHRDCMNLNIMMDATPMYPKPFHPVRTKLPRDFRGYYAKHYTRTQRPVKYFLTDFGLSRRYEAADLSPLEDPIWGGDKTVPEFQKSNQARDPFPTDVYYLGNLIREDFIVGNQFSSRKLGFEFMAELVADMVQDDPSKRPTMDEVVTRFETIRKGLTPWKLRSRVIKEGDSSLIGFFRSISHWTRRIGFVVTRRPALPAP